MKKFITLALLLLSPLPVLALDAAEANSRHQKAWYELIVKTDALLGVKTFKPLPTYPITAQMNTIDRQTRHMLEAAIWGRHVRFAVGQSSINKETEDRLHVLFSNYAILIAKEEASRFAEELQRSLRQATIKQNYKARVSAEQERDLDRIERAINNERLINAMEEGAEATNRLRNELEYNNLTTGGGISPTVLCRTIAETTICN